jgi:hypothetical protein
VAEIRSLSLLAASAAAQFAIDDDDPGPFWLKRVNIVVLGQRPDGSEVEIESIWEIPEEPDRG